MFQAVSPSRITDQIWLIRFGAILIKHLELCDFSKKKFQSSLFFEEVKGGIPESSRPCVCRCQVRWQMSVSYTVLQFDLDSAIHLGMASCLHASDAE